MNMYQSSDVWIGSSLYDFIGLDVLAFFQMLKSYQKCIFKSFFEDSFLY